MAKKQSTSEYYKKNPEAKKRRLKQQAEYNKREDQVKKRVSLNKANRKSHAAGTTKVGDGLDKSHTKKGTLVNEKASQNRKRNGSNGKSTKK
jgi:hypothetical protein